MNETEWKSIRYHVGAGVDTALLNFTVSDSLGNASLDDLAADEETLQRPALLKQPLPMMMLLCTAYVTVLLLAVFNNCMVVCAIWRTPALRTVTNCFITNLAIADILVSILVLPVTLLSNLFSEWQFGSFLCKAIPYLQAVAVSASVNTLAAVALERYIAIFHSQKAILQDANAALVVISIIWLVSVCIQTPWALYYRQNTFHIRSQRLVITLCYSQFGGRHFERGFYLGVVFLTCYLIPMCVITVFYTLIGLRVWGRSVAGIQGTKTGRNINKSKIRIVRMLITVAAVFALSWLPLYSIRMRILFGPSLGDWEKGLIEGYLVPIAQWLGAANSCINPFIYCYFCDHFRKSILNVLRSGSCVAVQN